jgi:hypothetical protein
MEKSAPERAISNPLLKKSTFHKPVDKIHESAVVRPYLGSTSLDITQVQSKIVFKYQQDREKRLSATSNMVLPQRMNLDKGKGKENKAFRNMEYDSFSSFNNAGFSGKTRAREQPQPSVSGDNAEIPESIDIPEIISRKPFAPVVIRSAPKFLPKNNFLTNKPSIQSSRQVDSLQPTVLAKRNLFIMKSSSIPTEKADRELPSDREETINPSDFMDEPPSSSGTSSLVESSSSLNKHDAVYEGASNGSSIEPPQEEVQTATKKSRKSKLPENLVSDNFVRLNMKNKQGSCRGSLNKKVKNDVFRRRQESLRSSSIIESLDAVYNGTNESQSATQVTEPQHGLRGLGLDPLDLCMESYEKQSAAKQVPKEALSKSNIQQQPHATSIRSRRQQNPLKDKILLQDIAPLCPGHRFNCKLCVVKKKGQNKVSVTIATAFMKLI